MSVMCLVETHVEDTLPVLQFTTFHGSERDFFFTAVTEVMLNFFIFDDLTFSSFCLVQVDN